MSGNFHASADLYQGKGYKKVNGLKGDRDPMEKRKIRVYAVVRNITHAF
jgi:hypothetical protein